MGPGSIPDSAKIFSLLLSLVTVESRAHLVLMQGILQMQLAAKAWSKYYKKFTWLSNRLAIILAAAKDENPSCQSNIFRSLLT